MCIVSVDHMQNKPENNLANQPSNNLTSERCKIMYWAGGDKWILWLECHHHEKFLRIVISTKFLNKNRMSSASRRPYLMPFTFPFRHCMPIELQIPVESTDIHTAWVTPMIFHCCVIDDIDDRTHNSCWIPCDPIQQRFQPAYLYASENRSYTYNKDNNNKYCISSNVYHQFSI